MRILSLEINGFRSLKDVSWTPGELNVVIGPNGSGKSNLLRMLELISISAKGGLGKYIQQSGGMEPLIWDRVLDGIGFSVKMSPFEDERSIERNSLTYQMKMIRLGKSSAFRIGDELLGNFHKVEMQQETEPFKLIERRNLFASVFDENKKKLTAPEESIAEEETLLSLAAGPFTQNRYIPPYQAGLAAWCIYHDLHVNRDAVIRQPAITRPEKRVDPDGQNLIPVLHTLYTDDRDFKKDIDSAMCAAFGDDYDGLVFPPASNQRTELCVRWKTLKRKQTAGDLSDGTLRFLFLLTVLATPSPAPLIAIDEPETGLHPSMLPIIAEYAVDASLRSQVIITTHSPQMLDAFGSTKPTTTVATWSDGETSLSVLDQKKLDYWLKEYSLGSLFRSGELEDME